MQYYNALQGNKTHDSEGKALNSRQILDRLKEELVIAMGCTEPAAAALCGSKAAELLGCVPEELNVYASRDMIKNAMSVGIPNCEEKGIIAAACLGIFSEAGVRDLSILAEVSEEQKRQAAELAGRARLCMAEDRQGVYIRADVKGGGHEASCTISGRHDFVSEAVRDGEVLLRRSPDDTDSMLAGSLKDLTIEDLVRFAQETDKQDLEFIRRGAEVNYDLACWSIEQGSGLEVAKAAMCDIPGEPRSLTEAFTCSAAMAAAASDARMSGCSRAVVINSGSGNQGITCTVPVLVIARYLHAPEEKLTEALCISELVGLMITDKKDRLSALCGAFTAAIGAGCGMVYLMGRGVREMNLLTRTMIANLSGIVCDGAKSSCALKIYSSVEAAGLAARMAINGSAPGQESGIVGQDGMDSVENLMNLSHNGMVQTDQVILSIMVDKQA